MRRSRRATSLYLSQGGIGLPDRDYYLKPDPKLREYRTKYVAYITAALTAAQVPQPRPPPPATSSPSRPAWRARTGPTSRAATR